MTNIRHPSNSLWKPMLVITSNGKNLYTEAKITESDYLSISPIWKELRKEKLEESFFRCQKCKAIHKLQVHHINYPEIWGEETADDLVVLCDSCHSKLHGKPQVSLFDFIGEDFQ